MEDVQLLLRIQECDLQVMRAKKRIEDLPEVAQIKECRERRKKIKTKFDQVDEALQKVENKLSALETENGRVSKKMEELQHTLDHNTDFRVTSAAMRDYEGQAKRKGNIAIEMDEYLEKQEDLEGKMATVNDLLRQVNARESELTEEFKRKGNLIKHEADERLAERTALIGNVDQTLARRYEKLRKEKKGLGIGYLEGRRCSACREELLDGQYRRLIAGPELAECPNCHRMLFAGEREAGE